MFHYVGSLIQAIPTPAADLINTSDVFTGVWSLTPSLMGPLTGFIALGLVFLVAKRTVGMGKKAAR